MIGRSEMVTARGGSAGRLLTLCAAGAFVAGFTSSGTVTDRLEVRSDSAAVRSDSAPSGGAASERLARERLRRTSVSHPSASVEEARALMDLASALCSSPAGSLAEARDAAGRAVKILESLRRGDDPALASALETLVHVEWVSGEFADEEPVIERALAIREKASPPDEPAVVKDLHYLADLRRVQGDLGAAHQIRERIGPILERLYPPDHPELAVHFHAVALIEEATGDFEAASEHAARAVEIRQKSLGPDDPLLAASLNLLGSILIRKGDLALARPPLERALAIWEATLGPYHADVARALENLGSLHVELSEYSRARPLLERSLSIRRRSFGPSHILVARSLSALGALKTRLGESASAEDLLRQAIRIQEKSPIMTHAELAASIRELALLKWAGGDAGQALRLALRAESISREHFLLTSGGLSEREALGEARARATGMHLALTAASGLSLLHAQDNEGATMALDEQIRSRALVQDVLAARHRVLALHPDSETASLVQALRRAQSRLAHLALEAPASRSPEGVPDPVQVARETEERAERALGERSREFQREMRRERIGLAEVSKALPQGSALVSYVRYEEASRTPGSKGAPRYAAFVLRADAQAPALVPLGSATIIDDSVERWAREVAVDPRLSRAGDAEAAYVRAARALGAAIWEPITSRLKGISQVFIVPDGALYRISFAALISPGGAYLVESGPAISYLAAERDLIRSEDAPARGRGVLALGDPDFNRRSEPGLTEPPRGGGVPCGDAGVLRFDPLPGSRREAAEVAERWGPPGEAVLLTGRDADEATFKRLAPSFKVLHLGTHAFFADGACERGPSRGAAPEERAPAQNPLRLAGLAMAGANTRDGSAAGHGREDGILLAEEIALLDLSGTEWAVLAACETGRGRLEEGEGILGLRRAFQIAGVRTLIMSLWPIEDEAARHWMRELYDARRAGAPTTEAVRRASVGLLESQSRLGLSTHPYYWAGFVALGDWR